MADNTAYIAALYAERDALQARLADIAAGEAGPPYSISTAAGSESVDVLAWQRWACERLAAISEQLQDLQPFIVRQQHVVRGGFYR